MKTVVKAILGLAMCLALYVAGAFTYGAGKYYFSADWGKYDAQNRAEMIRTGELTE